MIFDHLLQFESEKAARAALPNYWSPANDDDSPGAWRGDCCISNVSVYVVTGSETLTDAESKQEFERELRQAYPGWFIIIARPALDPYLRDPPGGACWRITDRDQAAIGGRKFVLHWSRPAEDLAGLRCEPAFAGDQVPQRMRAAPASTATAQVRQDWSTTVLVDGAQR